MKLGIFFLWASHLYSVVLIHQLPGQLGNNLFPLAAGISLALEKQHSISLPKFYQNHSATFFPYGNSPSAQEYFKTIFDRISQLVNEGKSSRFNQEEIELVGYFQNIQFFEKHKNTIRSLFSITPTIERYLENKFDFIQHPKTVGIHIRTYYADWKENRSFEWFPPDLEFYKQAIQMFDPDSIFIVCSDHIQWCKKHFPSHFIFIEDQEFIYDFFLLTKCKNLIVSGSTFGWWAAYLNEHPDCKIVSRNPFMDVYYESHSKNLYNPEWIHIHMPEMKPPIPIFDD